MTNKEMVLQGLGGDRQLLRELTDIFLQVVPRDLQDLERALDSQQHQHVQHHAHRLKASYATFAANDLAELALLIEERSELGDLSEVQPLLTELQSLSLAFIEELKNM